MKKLIAIVLVAILAAAGVAYMVAASDNADDGLVIRYDDYISYSVFAGEPASAAGSLELVTVGSTEYVWASDIGFGSLLFYDGTELEYDVKKANLSVYMIAGQSNGAYSVERSDPSMIDNIAPGTAYWYGAARPGQGIIENNSIQDMIDLSSGEALIGGLDAPLAAGLVDDAKVLIVNTAVGGTEIASWIPGQTQYERAKSLFADALTKIDPRFDVTVKSYIWSQGEADSLTSIGTYKAYFLLMHDSFTSANEFSPVPLKAAIIVQTRAIDGINSSIAQAELPTLSNTVFMGTKITQTFTVANGLMNEDDRHYTQAGQIVVAGDVSIKIRSMNL